MLDAGKSIHASCFQVQTATGYQTIVPNRFAEELRNHPDLNFIEAVSKDLFVQYPGFEGLRQGLEDEVFLTDLVRVKLTQSLGLVTEDLVEEMTDSVQDLFDSSSAWQSRRLKDDMLDVVSRLSTRVFLGKDSARNHAWLRISKNYTVDTFQAADELRKYPSFLRPIIYWFIPSCTKLHAEVKEARVIIEPEVKKRRMQLEESLRNNEARPKSADAINWMFEVSKGRPIDFVAAQLSLSVAAIHTTTETLTSCVLQLCDAPEMIGVLREEIIGILRVHGWSKTSLYQMKLLDSFLKEVQRTQASMMRLVKKPVTLSDGSHLESGSRIMICDDGPDSEACFPEPTKFDPARFLKLRGQPGEENRHQFVTPAANHMAFGYGKHACPGRFFASNEIKIALSVLLLEFDFEYMPGQSRPPPWELEVSRTVDPEVEVRIRRRVAEINVRNPQEVV
ncbi:hypothetical protein FH972_022730 [Carpinus fangiana]|uniref:Cytochrome P450 n=1 Tax=Carpinus fangiana TaxID=176857 RepID=A0A5N6KT37_9ROSI|nr:hypothetical protein FH972_022730 [Carpinus fangiana]